MSTDDYMEKFKPPGSPIPENSMGSRIRNARIASGLTQKKLAELIGSATGTIQQYELNLRTPRKTQLEKIVKETGFPVSFFQATPPFEDLRFLQNFKAVIIYDLDERGSFHRNGRSISEISDYEYWHAIAKNIVSIVHGKGNSLNIQYKTSSDREFAAAFSKLVEEKERQTNPIFFSRFISKFPWVIDMLSTIDVRVEIDENNELLLIYDGATSYISQSDMQDIVITSLSDIGDYLKKEFGLPINIWDGSDSFDKLQRESKVDTSAAEDNAPKLNSKK